MTPVYSIIIPVYNAEKYLEQCIESVLNQRCASTLEVILVNDGSRDGSGAICDRYAAHSACIQVIHQQNQGVSAARNAGLNAAQGEYVLFLDSDDLWEPNLLTSVDEYLPQRPDMVIFGHGIFTDRVIKRVIVPTCTAAGESGESYFGKLEKTGGLPIVSACMIAFRREFLLEHGLRFPVGVSYGEDFRLCMHSLKRAQSVYTIDKALYLYRVNELSATHTPDVKKIRDVLSSCVEIYDLFPGSLLADYYCMSIWTIEGLKREDAVQLYGFLRENRGILKQVSGTQARLARLLYTVFGWHGGAKLLRLIANVRNSIKE